MQQPALYFPYVHVRDEAWLKAAALYWPSVRRMVPYEYPKRDSATADAFAEAEILRDEAPGGLLLNLGWDLFENVKANARQLQRDYSIDRAFEAWAARQHSDAHDEYLARRMSYRGQVWPSGPPTALEWLTFEKLDPDTVEFLESAGLAVYGRHLDEPWRDWVGLHPTLAGAYMTAMAGRISEINRFQPLTDQDDLRVATPNASVRSAISVLLGRRAYDATSRTYAAEGVEAYVMLALQYAVPARLSDVSAESIIECREDLSEELATFRAYVADQQAELAELASLQLTDRRVEAFAAHVAETIEIPLRRLERGLQLHKLEPARSLLLTGSVATPVVASPLLGSPLAASAAGAAAAIGGAWWKIQTLREDLRAESQVGYLLDVRDRLTPRSVAARARKLLLGAYG